MRDAVAREGTKTVELACAAATLERLGLMNTRLEVCIRGVLTTGETWMFLILVMDPDGDGAKYWQSEKLKILVHEFLQGPIVTPPAPDLIVGLLAHWVAFPPLCFISIIALLTYVHGSS